MAWFDFDETLVGVPPGAQPIRAVNAAVAVTHVDTGAVLAVRQGGADVSGVVTADGRATFQTTEPVCRVTALGESRTVMSSQAKIAVFPAGDTSVATLVNNPTSQTRAALSGTYARRFKPEAFGAVGDGVADDYNAFVNADLAAGAVGGVVELDAKSYYLASRLTLNSSVVGKGITESIIKGAIAFGSNLDLCDFRVGDSSLYNAPTDGCTNTRLTRVHIGGVSGHGLYLDGTSASKIKFVDCVFSDCTSNGVQIVDKGTVAKHYENIQFVRCDFRNNGRMNFECVVRQDGLNDVVSGYRNVSHHGCTFGATTGATVPINVSYDSVLLTDGTARAGGYSTMRGCEITGGNSYGLELAGATRMRIVDNDISDTLGSLLSISAVNNEVTRHIISGNRFTGTADIIFQGGENLIADNYCRTNGRFRFWGGNNSLIVGNHIECLGTTAISVENAYNLRFVGNDIIGGAGQSVLNIGAVAINNWFTGNYINNYNVIFDQRDGTLVYRQGNFKRAGLGGGAHAYLESFPVLLTLPTYSAVHHRNMAAYIAGATGVRDTLAVGLKDAGDVQAFRHFAFTNLGQTFTDVQAFTGTLRVPTYTTVGRPAAATAGAGAHAFDTTLGRPIWSDGTAWRDAAGAVV